MSAQARTKIVRFIMLGALAVAVASLVSGGLLVLSDYATRAQASQAVMAGGDCGGTCADEPGSCAAEGMETADQASGCPMSKATEDAADCDREDCTDCDADCPHNKTANEAADCDGQECADCDADCPHNKTAAEAADCEGQDCTDCDADCPHRKSATPPEPTEA
jgi:hypothetical protein